MNEREKSLELAKLMGWKVYSNGDIEFPYDTFGTKHKKIMCLDPYGKTPDGLAQFAAILLRNPGVLVKYVNTSGHTRESETTKERYIFYGGTHQGYIDGLFRQEEVLDDILRMNEVEI